MHLLLKEITDVTMYQRKIEALGINMNVLPFSSIKTSNLQVAQTILLELLGLAKESDALKTLGLKADYTKINEVNDQISDLSNKYYELIPLKQYKN